jgi:hypothetical protein
MDPLIPRVAVSMTTMRRAPALSAVEGPAPTPLLPATVGLDAAVGFLVSRWSLFDKVSGQRALEDVIACRNH